jgi:hypothetical protein
LWAVATTWVRETLILHNPETKIPNKSKSSSESIYLNKEHNLFDFGEEEPKKKKKKKPSVWQLLQA